MEDTLRANNDYTLSSVCNVLILVLMEDTLRVLDRFSQQDLPKSLNPCFNGRYSQSKAEQNAPKLDIVS